MCKGIVYITIVLLVLSMCLGCSERIEYRMEKIEKMYGSKGDSLTCCYHFLYEYPVVTESFRNVRDAKVNELIDSFRYDRFSGDPEDHFYSKLEKFKGFKARFPSSASIPWFEEHHFRPDTHGGNILRLTYSNYINTGGAHPYYRADYLNIDYKRALPIEPDDIFLSGYKDILDSLGELKFRRMRNINPDMSLDSAGFRFENSEFSLNDNFLIRSDGLIFHFNSYEIGGWAAGPTDIRFSYEEISHLIDSSGPLAGIINKSR